MVIDKHITDFTGTKCNKVGSTYRSLHTMENRCYRKEETYDLYMCVCLCVYMYVCVFVYLGK